MNYPEMFVEFIDTIYFDGYAKNLSENDPVKFMWEYDEFVSSLN